MAKAPKKNDQSVTRWLSADGRFTYAEQNNGTLLFTINGDAGGASEDSLESEGTTLAQATRTAPILEQWS